MHNASELLNARKARKLTQAQLAELLGTTRQTVAQWETGRKEPDEETMKQLVEILGLDTFAVAAKEPVSPKKFWLSMALAFVCGLLVASLLFYVLIPALTASPKADLANISSWEWYQTPIENVPGKPYLKLEPIASTVKLTHSTDASSEFEFFWRYGYTLQEMNGIPFTVTRIEDNRFNAQKERTDVFELPIESLIAGWGTVNLSANAFKRAVRIMPAHNESIGLGIAVYITDASGEEMVFPCYIELSQEVEERLAYTATAFENDTFENNGAALLAVEPQENPVPLGDDPKFVDGRGWNYTLIMKNITENDLQLKEIVQLFFMPDGKESIREIYPEAQINEWLPSLTLAPGAEQDFRMGADLQDFGYSGLSVFFEDAQGNPYESRALFTLQQE